MNPLIFTAAPTLDPTPTPPEPRPSQLLPGWLAIVISGLLGWLGPLTLAIALGPPNPYITDEFFYLLAADTFAHGRLTNPPIPDEIASFIEAPLQPTRMLKYPPGQGLGGIVATETASRRAKQQATVNLSTKHGVDLKLSSIEGNHLVFFIVRRLLKT